MAFDKDKPAASTSLRTSNPEILENNESVQDAVNREHIFAGTAAGTQTGDHTQGSARCFSQASAPATRIDGDGFLSTDLGSLWIDTDDNAVYVLTATTPTWTPVSTEVIETLLASNRAFLGVLACAGNFTVNGKFDVAAANGNTIVAGTLDVTGVMTTTAASVLGDGSTLAAATESGDSDRTIADKAYVDNTVTVGGVVQVVATVNATPSTITGEFPYDNTTPVITEGSEVMTATITPGSASNKLMIQVNVVVSAANAVRVGVGLYNTDSSATDPVAFVSDFEANNGIQSITLIHFMTAPSGSATTFRVRIGSDNGDIYLNQGNNELKYNGTLTSTITITELQV